jgi:hypothetical protein
MIAARAPALNRNRRAGDSARPMDRLALVLRPGREDDLLEPGEPGEPGEPLEGARHSAVIESTLR